MHACMNDVLICFYTSVAWQSACYSMKLSGYYHTTVWLQLFDVVPANCVVERRVRLTQSHSLCALVH